MSAFHNRKRLLPLLSFVCIAGMSASSHAAGARTDFGVTVGPAILCRDKLDMKFMYDYLSGSFGAPYKREQGAYWFRTKAQLFGKDVTEVFVSDQSSEWEFVGALFKIKPDELVKGLQTSDGLNFVKTELGYQYTPFKAQGLSEVMWQSNNAKMLCRHHVTPP